MAQPALNSLKVYGVSAIDSSEPTSPAPGTELVRYRALAAIVEPSAYAAVNLDDGEMDKYLRVLDEAHAHAAVLPAPPGTVFRSHSTLTQWLELHYFTLTEALALVEGHASARVNIASHAGVTEPDAQKRVSALAAESLRLLRTQAAATVTLPAAEGDDQEGIIARASFLVDSQRWATFEEALEGEAKRQPALDFRLSGPWPPYDFVRMQFGA